MKKFAAFIIMLVTTLLLTAISAFPAGVLLSGAYGPYVPYGGNFDSEQGVGSQHTVVFGGFYSTRVPFSGAYGVTGEEWGTRTALSGSCGAYGPYPPQKRVAEASRSNCMVVATVCSLDIFKKPPAACRPNDTQDEASM